MYKISGGSYIKFLITLCKIKHKISRDLNKFCYPVVTRQLKLVNLSFGTRQFRVHNLNQWRKACTSSRVIHITTMKIQKHSGAYHNRNRFKFACLKNDSNIRNSIHLIKRVSDNFNVHFIQIFFR